jgi:hypothetical protein
VGDQHVVTPEDLLRCKLREVYVHPNVESPYGDPERGHPSSMDANRRMIRPTPELIVLDNCDRLSVVTFSELLTAFPNCRWLMIGDRKMPVPALPAFGDWFQQIVGMMHERRQMFWLAAASTPAQPQPQPQPQPQSQSPSSPSGSHGGRSRGRTTTPIGLVGRFDTMLGLSDYVVTRDPEAVQACVNKLFLNIPEWVVGGVGGVRDQTEITRTHYPEGVVNAYAVEHRRGNEARSEAYLCDVEERARRMIPLSYRFQGFTETGAQADRYNQQFRMRCGTERKIGLGDRVQYRTATGLMVVGVVLDYGSRGRRGTNIPLDGGANPNKADQDGGGIPMVELVRDMGYDTWVRVRPINTMDQHDLIFRGSRIHHLKPAWFLPIEWFGAVPYDVLEVLIVATDPPASGGGAAFMTRADVLLAGANALRRIVVATTRQRWTKIVECFQHTRLTLFSVQDSGEILSPDDHTTALDSFKRAERETHRCENEDGAGGPEVPDSDIDSDSDPCDPTGSFSAAGANLRNAGQRLLLPPPEVHLLSLPTLDDDDEHPPPPLPPPEVHPPPPSEDPPSQSEVVVVAVVKTKEKIGKPNDRIGKEKEKKKKKKKRPIDAGNGAPEEPPRKKKKTKPLLTDEERLAKKAKGRSKIKEKKRLRREKELAETDTLLDSD